MRGTTARAKHKPATTIERDPRKNLRSARKSEVALPPSHEMKRDNVSDHFSIVRWQKRKAIGTEIVAQARPSMRIKNALSIPRDDGSARNAPSTCTRKPTAR